MSSSSLCDVGLWTGSSLGWLGLLWEELFSFECFSALPFLFALPCPLEDSCFLGVPPYPASALSPAFLVNLKNKFLSTGIIRPSPLCKDPKRWACEALAPCLIRYSKLLCNLSLLAYHHSADLEKTFPIAISQIHACFGEKVLSAPSTAQQHEQQHALKFSAKA